MVCLISEHHAYHHVYQIIHQQFRCKYLASQMPYVKFILPTAPTQPVTLNMGMAMPSWYDIVGLDSRSNEFCEGIDDSIDKILDLLEHEVVGPLEEATTEDDVTKNDNTSSCKSTTLDYSRVVLAGFSQGGALALYTGMTQHRKQQPSKGLELGGIVVMSGYLPRSKQFTVANGSESTPILHCHGEQDSVVPVQAAEISRDRVSSLVKEMGGEDDDELYKVKTYSDLDHSVSMEELNDVASFLKSVIPPIAE